MAKDDGVVPESDEWMVELHPVTVAAQALVHLLKLTDEGDWPPLVSTAMQHVFEMGQQTKVKEPGE